MPSQESIVVARESFVFNDGGYPRQVAKGATVRVGHPMLKGREGMFAPLVVDFDHTIAPTSSAPKTAGRR